MASWRGDKTGGNRYALTSNFSLENLINLHQHELTLKLGWHGTLLEALLHCSSNYHNMLAYAP
jgi:hypothetical protein